MLIGYGIYACNGILFNHESPIRGETFVTRKITRAIARIALGLQDCLYLGNLGALRDWGHARDYVQMQWLMLQQAQAEDFVIATGMQHSVREFVQRAAAELGIELRFEGDGAQEVAVVASVRKIGDELRAKCKPGEVIVRVDPRYFRPTEVQTLLGDPSKAKEARLGADDELRRVGARDGGQRLHQRPSRQPGQAGRLPGLRLPRVSRAWTLPPASSSPATAAWSAAPSCAGCRPPATGNC